MYLGASDFFYITSTDAIRFARMGRQMLESGVFLEIAVPTILKSITDNIQILGLWTSWDAQRGNPAAMAASAQEAIQHGVDIVHPVKISILEGAMGHMII